MASSTIKTRLCAAQSLFIRGCRRTLGRSAAPPLHQCCLSPGAGKSQASHMQGLWLLTRHVGPQEKPAALSSHLFLHWLVAALERAEGGWG